MAAQGRIAAKSPQKDQLALALILPVFHRMLVIVAPDKTSDLLAGSVKIFLAGSIEMGMAERWQDEIPKTLEICIQQLPEGPGYITMDKLVLFNPRRTDWNSETKQSRDDPYFSEQVSWELACLQQADWIIMYFDAATKSPISLLELGLYARSGKLVVVCPKGFWRKGNVDILCDTFQIVQRDTLLDACRYIIEQVNKSR